MRRLLAAGADPNQASFWGVTALHAACCYNNEEAARALLADPRTDRARPDSRGRTAADLAKLNGYRKLAKEAAPPGVLLKPRWLLRLEQAQASFSIC